MAPSKHREVEDTTMHSAMNVDPTPAAAKRGNAKGGRSLPTIVTHALGLLLAAVVALAPTTARAVDGCLSAPGSPDSAWPASRQPAVR